MLPSSLQKYGEEFYLAEDFNENLSEDGKKRGKMLWMVLAGVLAVLAVGAGWLQQIYSHGPNALCQSAQDGDHDSQGIPCQKRHSQKNKNNAVHHPQFPHSPVICLHTGRRMYAAPGKRVFCDLP